MFKSLIYFAFIASILSCFSGNATQIYWAAGNSNGIWNEPTNWDLGRVPIASDSVFTSYSDKLVIPSGYTASCTYFKLLGDITIIGDLEINNGQFDALGDVINYGSITISNSPEEGLIFSTQAAAVTFENYGDIYIDQSAEEGFVIRNDQEFTNYGAGFIEITNSTLDNFKVDGIFNNFGTLKVQSSNIDIGISMWNNAGASAEINNELCGRIILNGKFVVSEGTFNNNGFIRQNFDGQNDLQGALSTFNNYAILEDILGSFEILDFDVQSVWLNPLGIEVNTGEPTTPMVNNLPSNFTFSDVYTSRFLDVNAGSYDPVTNIWTPNANANGDSTFFLEIGLTIGGSPICFDTVRFDLETPVLETIYWVGGSSGSWQFGFNWSTGSVPTINDHVGVYNTTDSIFMPVTYNASARSMDLNGKLTIPTFANLTIDGAGSIRGIRMEQGKIINNGMLNINECLIGVDANNAIIINNQKITCTNTNTNINTCIEINQNGGLTASLINDGTIENNQGDLIYGDEAEVYNKGLLTGKFPYSSCVFSRNLINEGIIEVEGNGSPGSKKGVAGTIINEMTGTVFVEKLNIGFESTFNSSAPQGVNSGIIHVEMCDIGIKIYEDYTNLSGGEMIILHSGVGFENLSGVFENDQGALISINGSSQYGLSAQENLYNEGLIEIDSTNGAGVYCGSDITNRGSGVIIVRNSDTDGIHLNNYNSDLTNEGQGEIRVMNAGGYGIRNEGGSIINQNNGIITIDTIGMSAIYLTDDFFFVTTYYSTFTNEAQIIIGSDVGSFGIENEFGNTFTNSECAGKIINYDRLANAGFFINNGIYQHFNPLSIITTTNIQNNGIIHDPNASFTPGNVSNNGIYIGQKSGTFTEGETINNPLAISNSLSTGFQTEANWYVDNNLNTIGGQYDATQNELTVNGAAVDSSTFYFRVLNNTCSPATLDTLYLIMELPIERVCSKIEWGGGSGSWSNVSKWIGDRLPSACDTADISGMLDSVFINVTQPIQVGSMHNNGFVLISPSSSLTVLDGQGNGVENEGLIRNLGQMSIHNMILNGYVGFAGSELINEGNISLNSILENGFLIENAILRNTNIGTINIDNVVNDDLLIENGSTFIQKGNVNIND